MHCNTMQTLENNGKQRVVSTPPFGDIWTALHLVTHRPSDSSNSCYPRRNVRRLAEWSRRHSGLHQKTSPQTSHQRRLPSNKSNNPAQRACYRTSTGKQQLTRLRSSHSHFVNACSFSLSLISLHTSSKSLAFRPQETSPS